MTILHIVGKPRQGKGILMSYLGLGAADAGVPVDTNYHLRSPGARWIDFYDLLSFLKLPRQEPPHLLLIDELPGWCDSYVTQAKSSRFASHFLNQSAKLGYDLIFTSQRTMRADINFRELSDFRLMAEKDEARQQFNYHILDPEETTEDVYTGRKISMSFAQAALFWSRYDTYEAVPPVGLDEVLAECEKFDSEKLLLTVNRQVAILREKWVLGEKVDKLSVTSALLDEREPIAHAALVAYRLARELRRKSNIQLPTQIPTAMESTPELTSLDRWRTLQIARTT